MRRELLHYELPDALVASHPPAERDGGRLLVVPRGGAAGEVEHAHVRGFDELVPEGALVVLNDTRVLPARLFGARRPHGGRVELLLLRRLEGSSGRSERWEAFGRASKPLREGTRIDIDDRLAAEIVARGDGGVLAVRLDAADGRTVTEAIDALGHVPLPPYLGRDDEPADRERYQTVFARVPGAVAAPTAGLHVTDALLGRLAARGVETARVTLHVGAGTFQPVSADDLDAHPMHAEAYCVPASAAAAVERARARRAPIVAVGTTVVRALESAAADDGTVRETRGETRLLIQPGYRFRAVDLLLTNFHQPGSTLLALVFALAGRERVLAAYREAIASGYRFLSYGDAMLLHRAEPR